MARTEVSVMPRSFVLALLFFLILAGCGSTSGNGAGAGKDSGAPPADASASDGSSDASVDAADGGPTLIIEPDQGMTPVYALISSAKQTLDMTMYELVDTQATTLLTQAATNGVKVRVILDQNDEMSDNTPAYNTLADGGVQVHWANPIYEATHQKTLTVDGTTSAIMTLNLEATDYATSRDFAVVTEDQADVAAIERVFDNDFTNTGIAPPTGDDLVWSPTNAQSALVGIIQGATSSLLVENEEMSDDTIVSALIASATKGVDVKVIMESSSTYATEFEALMAAGVNLRVYRHSHLYIHAKVILADYGTGASKCFIGSENFSHASLTANRELGLITSDPSITAQIEATLTSDYDGGTVFVPPDAGTTADSGASTLDASDSGDAADSGDAGEPADSGDAGD
jgi:phosphatidylserine/phosphatidylglycerophosphate/cardiolipin synthase-like enzyme